MSRLLPVERDLRRLANPAKAQVLQGFFKTGPGEYGEGDKFLGITMPEIRKLVRAYANVDQTTSEELLRSSHHEARMLALLIMVKQFQSTPEARSRADIFRTYLQVAHNGCINNWDLVDVTAPHIVGAHLFTRSRKPLTRLAHSASLWERRIAIVATQFFIQRGDSIDTLRLADMLLYDQHDLIHKAVGWMLREVGKHCSVRSLEVYLKPRYQTMPRTMLRYAIERLPAPRRSAYLKGHI